MTIKIEPIDAIPQKTPAQRMRMTETSKIVETMRQSVTQKVEVTADSPRELLRACKSLTQFRRRHPDWDFKMMKAGDTLYLWMPDES